MPVLSYFFDPDSRSGIILWLRFCYSTFIYDIKSKLFHNCWSFAHIILRHHVLALGIAIVTFTVLQTPAMQRSHAGLCWRSRLPAVARSAAAEEAAQLFYMLHWLLASNPWNNVWQGLARQGLTLGGKQVWVGWVKLVVEPDCYRIIGSIV